MTLSSFQRIYLEAGEGSPEKASSYILCFFIVYSSNNQYTKVAHFVTLQHRCARIYPGLESSRACRQSLPWGKFLQLRGWPVLTPGRAHLVSSLNTERLVCQEQELGNRNNMTVVKWKKRTVCWLEATKQNIHGCGQSLKGNVWEIKVT